VTVVVRSVGWISGGIETETTAGEAFAEVPEVLSEVVVRPARFDVAALFSTPPDRLARMDRICHLSLAAAKIALDRAGPPLPGPVAVVVESGLATIGTNDAYFRKLLRRGPRGVDPKRFPYTSPNAAAGEIAIAFGLDGPNLAIPGGFTGGLVALSTADGLLRAGRAACAVVVGADALSLAAVAWLAFSGEGIDPPGEAGVAMVLSQGGEGPGLCDVREAFDPSEGRQVDPYGDDLSAFGDLPGSAGLLALARAFEAGRAGQVAIRGSDGLSVCASLTPRSGPSR